MALPAAKKQARKVKQKSNEAPKSGDFSGVSSGSSELLVEDPGPAPKPKSALDSIIDSLDLSTFVIFDNVMNRPPSMRAAAPGDNSARLKLCMYGFDCPRRDEDCPYTHVQFSEKNTWNPEEDELYNEVSALVPASPPRTPPRTPSPPAVHPPPIAQSIPTSLNFSGFSGSYSNFSYAHVQQPYSSGFLVGSQPYQGGGFTSSGLYTGPAVPPPRPWLGEEDKERPVFLSRELSKLGLHEKRKVRVKEKEKRKSLPSVAQIPRWSISRGPSDMGSLSRVDMSGGILVQV